MKFLADEGVDAPIVKALKEEGFHVFYIAEEDPGIEDEAILQKAQAEELTLITRDKDFGELVYHLGKLHSGVILIRLAGIKPKTKAEIILSVIRSNLDFLNTSFIVIQPGIVRIRQTKP